MLHFIYTYSETARRNHPTIYTVRVYRIRRNRPEKVAELSDTFVSEFQLVMMAMEAKKLLPRRAFDRHPQSNSLVYGVAWALREAGIADITRVI